MSDESQSTASTSFGSVASETYDEMVADVAACATMESLVCGKGMPKVTKQRARRRPGPMRTPTKAVPFSAYERVAAVVKACRAERKRAPLDPNAGDVEDERLFKMARFTDGMALDNYAPFLHYVPRLVNIVGSSSTERSLPLRPSAPAQTAHAHPTIESHVNSAAGHTSGGHPRQWLGAHAAARPLQDRLPLQRRLLCEQAVRGRSGAAPCSDALSISVLTSMLSTCSQLAYTHPRCRVLVFRKLPYSNHASTAT